MMGAWTGTALLVSIALLLAAVACSQGAAEPPPQPTLTPAAPATPTPAPADTSSLPPNIAILEAVAEGDYEAALRLIDAGADVNSAFVEAPGPGFGGSPLHLAALTERPEIAELLLDHGAMIDIRAKDEFGGTPLHWAAFVGQPVMIKYLVESGSDVNAPDKYGYTPLDAVLNSPSLGGEPKGGFVEFLIANNGMTRDAAAYQAAKPPAGRTAETDWPLPNYDQSSSRATFESEINSGNVHHLTEAWRYVLPQGPPFGAAATTPVVVDGTVYLGDLSTNVHAIELFTGKRRWMAEVNTPIFGPSGVAVQGGRVFANKGGAGIAAYDAETGNELWSADILAKGGAVNIQPTVADGKVLAATSSLSQPGARGALYALDQESGNVLWSFDTIESPDLWGHPEINSGGGAWYPPSIDLERRVSYWGTSNPYPFPGAEGFPNGSSRPGDNRWTNSILAIDLDTGKLIWGHQAAPHDLFDRDAIITAIVESPDISPSPVIISAGKLGRVIGLDADGRVLWDTPVGMHQNDHLTSFEGELEVLPGAAGGIVTPIATAEGVIYAPVVNAPITYTGPEESSAGAGAELGSFNSRMVAIDAASGEIVWDVELPGDSFGGATVVNDLVFTSVLSGLILALDRQTGETVWTYQAPGGINGWPAFVEDMLIIPVGFGDPPTLLALGLSGGQ